MGLGNSPTPKTRLVQGSVLSLFLDLKAIPPLSPPSKGLSSLWRAAIIGVLSGCLVVVVVVDEYRWMIVGRLSLVILNPGPDLSVRLSCSGTGGKKVGLWWD